MPFQYSCFISYRHGEGELLTRFIEELKKSLKSSLEPYLTEGIFIDDRLSAGYRYNEALARAICQSVCMIVVYAPIYERSSYCLREFTAMQLLEEERFKALEEQLKAKALEGAFPPEFGLIIPILLRGKAEELPPRIRGHIHFCDFSKFTTASVEMTRHQEFVDKIEQIARYIYDVYESFQRAGWDPCSQCTSFRLPDEQKVQPWRTPVPAAFPLREGTP